MRKEYVKPATDVYALNLESSFCVPISNGEGDGNQFGKEYDDEDGFWNDED